MDSAPPITKLRRLGRAIAAFTFCPLLGGAITWLLLRPVDVGRGMTQRGAEFGDFCMVYKARLAAENDHNNQLPPEALTVVYAFAVYLARTQNLEGLNSWFSSIDPAWRLGAKHPKSILLPARGDSPAPINPDFLGAPLTVAVALVPSASRLPGETPVVWTRGLQTDGTWREDSPYYGAGGFICLAGNPPAFYADLHAASLKKWGTNEPTSNIIEALPPGTRIGEYVPLPEIGEYVRLLKRPPIISWVLSSLLMLVCSLWVAGIPRRNSPERWSAMMLLGILSATWFWFSVFHRPVNDLIKQHYVSVSKN